MNLRSLVPFLLAGAIGACDDDPVTPSTALGTVTITPATLTLTAGQTGDVAVSAKTVGGADVTNGIVTLAVANKAIADLTTAGKILGVGAGSTTVTATVVSGGVVKTAVQTVTVTGTLPNALAVVAGAASNDFTPATGAIARNGTVTWTSGARPHNVVFSVANGAPNNIPTGTNLNVSRTFATGGDFSYQCTVHQGMGALLYVR